MSPLELIKLSVFIFLVVFAIVAFVYIVRVKLTAVKEEISFMEAVEVLAVKDGARPSKGWIDPRNRKKETEAILPPAIEEELKNRRS